MYTDFCKFVITTVQNIIQNTQTQVMFKGYFFGSTSEGDRVLLYNEILAIGRDKRAVLNFHEA